MLRNIIGPNLDSKKCVLLDLLFCSFFFKISFSLQKEEYFWKTKKEKQRKIGPSFDSKKGYFWTKFWLYSIYIGPFKVLLSGPSLFFTKRCLSKNTINILGFSTFFWKKIARACYYLGPSWPFLSCSQLGPDNNTYLAQIITPQNVFFKFLLLKMCWNTYFIVFLNINQNWAKKGQKTITFHILQNTGW